MKKENNNEVLKFLKYNFFGILSFLLILSGVGYAALPAWDDKAESIKKEQWVALRDEVRDNICVQKSSSGTGCGSCPWGKKDLGGMGTSFCLNPIASASNNVYSVIWSNYNSSGNGKSDNAYGAACTSSDIDTGDYSDSSWNARWLECGE